MWPLLCWLSWLVFLLWLGGLWPFICWLTCVAFLICIATMEDSNDWDDDDHQHRPNRHDQGVR
jgi:hypothetical protein